MAKTLHSKLQSRRDSYNEEVLKIEQDLVKKDEIILETQSKQEKLKKSKELLLELSGLLSKRSEKAKQIFTFINTGKGTDSLIEEVKIINNDVKKIQQSLKSMQDLSESICVCLVDVLGDDIQSTEIVKVTEKINQELSKISKLLVDLLDLNETSKALRKRYLGYISYIDKCLDGARFMDFDDMEDGLKADLVYQYAEIEGMDDVIEKMQKRVLTCEEYENILIKFNPLCAYIIHMINVSGSEIDKQEYYSYLVALEKGTIAQGDRKSLESKCDHWLIYKKEGKEVFNSVDGVENYSNDGLVEIEAIIARIPNKWEGNFKTNGKIIGEILNQDTLKRLAEKGPEKLEEKLLLLAEAFKEKGRKDIVERNHFFESLRKRQVDEEVKKETGGVFNTKEKYNEFKKRKHNSEECNKFIESGNVNFVVSHLKYFTSLDEEILNKLCMNMKEKVGFVNEISKNSESFKLDVEKILIKLLDCGYEYKELYTFFGKKSDFGLGLARKLIECGYFEKMKELVKNKKFVKLNSEIAILIMDNIDDGIMYVATHLQYFENLNCDIKNKIMSTEYGWLCDKYKNSFYQEKEIFTTEDYITKIEKKYTSERMLNSLIVNLKQTDGLDYKRILDALLNKKISAILIIIIYNLGNFKGVDHKYVVEKLIEKGMGWAVAKNLERFEGLNHEDIANRLIKEGMGWAVAKNLEKFDLSGRLIEKLNKEKYSKNFEPGGEDELAKVEGANISTIDGENGVNREEIDYQFESFTKDDIEAYMSSKNPLYQLLLNLDKIKKDYHKWIILELINRDVKIVTGNKVRGWCEKVDGFDQEILDELVKKGGKKFVLQYFEKFIIEDKEKLFVKLVKEVASSGPILLEKREGFVKLMGIEKMLDLLIKTGKLRYVVKNLDKIGWQYYKNIANRLMENGFGERVVRDIANKLIKNGFGEYVLQNIEDFKGVNRDLIVTELINNGDKDLVIKYKDKFDDIEESLRSKNVREFLKDYISLSEELYGGDILEELKIKYKEKYGKDGLPNSRSDLLRILGGKPGCTSIEYYKALLISKKNGDIYFENLNKRRKLIDRIKGDLREILENREEVAKNKIEEIKTKLRSWGLSEAYLDLINLENVGIIRENKIDEVYRKSENNQGFEFEEVCNMFKFSGVVIYGHCDRMKEEDIENRDVQEEYSIHNLGRIQHFLNIKNGAWESFKGIILEDGKVERKDLDAWINDTGFEVKSGFEYKLSHFGIKILDREDAVDFKFETGEQFVEKLELLGFKCANREILIENIKRALSKKGMIVVGLKSSLCTTLERLSHYKNSGDKKEESPFATVITKNKNPKFSVIKYKRGSGKVPRFIFSSDEKTVLNIVSHEDYDKLRKGTKKNKIEFEGIEGKIFW